MLAACLLQLRVQIQACPCMTPTRGAAHQGPSPSTSAPLQEELLLVGPYGDMVSYDTEPGMHLLQEADGARLLTPERHELLRRVPPATVDVFEPGSTSPGKPQAGTLPERKSQAHDGSHA